MLEALRYSSVVLTVIAFYLGLASASADTHCKRWPLLANYNITSKEFTCTGAITAFRLCNLHSFTHVGVTVWRRGKGVQGRRVEYANSGFDILHNELAYSRGDQLDYMISYYYSPNNNEDNGCHIPLAFTTNFGYNCTGHNPKIYLKVTEECFQDVNETASIEGHGTGESTNAPSTATTSTTTTSSVSRNTTTNSSEPVRTTSPPTLSGSRTENTTKPHPAPKTEENSTNSSSEATTSAATALPTSSGSSTESNTRPHSATKVEGNSTNPGSLTQNSSSTCHHKMAEGASHVSPFRLGFGPGRNMSFTAMLIVIVFLLLVIVLETVVAILVCFLCRRCGRNMREEEGNSNKPLKIGYRKAEEHDIALLGMDEPTEST